jgi:hypothetical protein
VIKGRRPHRRASNRVLEARNADPRALVENAAACWRKCKRMDIQYEYCTQTAWSTEMVTGVAEVGLGCEHPTRDGSGDARCLSAKRHVVRAAFAQIWGGGGGGVGPGYDWKRSCALCRAGDRTNDARVVAKQKPPPITFTFPQPRRPLAPRRCQMGRVLVLGIGRRARGPPSP